MSPRSTEATETGMAGAWRWAGGSATVRPEHAEIRRARARPPERAKPGQRSETNDDLAVMRALLLSLVNGRRRAALARRRPAQRATARCSPGHYRVARYRSVSGFQSRLAARPTRGAAGSRRPGPGSARRPL